MTIVRIEGDDEHGDYSEELLGGYEADTLTGAEAVQAVIDQILGGGPLEAGVTVTAIPKPDKPIRITRLADMSEFEAEWGEWEWEK